jgi:hypothetical protein
MKKTRHRRTRTHKPTSKQRSDAIAALHSIAVDPNEPGYVKHKAAAAILAADRADDADPEMADAADPIFTVLPDNGRNPNVRFGLVGDDKQRVVIVPRGFPYEVRPESYYADVPKPIGVTAERYAAIEKQRLAPSAPDPWGDAFDESDPEIATMKRLCDAAGLPPAREAA